MKKEWKKVATERVFTCPYLNVDKSTFENDTGYRDDFFTLPFGDWVHVIPVLDDARILMIELYRFGSETVSLEFPGGQIDLGGTAAEAAERELMEETGYSCESLISLGWSYPNPAIQSNRCHFFIASNVKAVSKQDLEPAEDISLRIMTLNDLSRVVRDGGVTHSLALVGYMKYVISQENYRLSN